MVADVRAKAGGHSRAPRGELGVDTEGGVGRLGPDVGSEKHLGAELDVLNTRRKWLPCAKSNEYRASLPEK